MMFTKLKKYPLVVTAAISLIAIVICLVCASKSVGVVAQDHATGLTLVFNSQDVIKYSIERVVCSFSSNNNANSNVIKNMEAQIQQEEPATAKSLTSLPENCIYYANLGKISHNITELTALFYNKSHQAVGFTKVAIATNTENITLFPKVYALSKDNLYLDSSTHLVGLNDVVKCRLEAVAEDSDLTANLTKLVNFNADTTLLQPSANAPAGTFQSLAYTTAEGTTIYTSLPLVDGDFTINSSPIYITNQKLVSVSLQLDSKNKTITKNGYSHIPFHVVPNFNTKEDGATPSFKILPKDVVKCSVDFNHSEIKNAEVIADGSGFFVQVQPKMEECPSDLIITATFDAGALMGEHKMFAGLLKTKID